MTNRDKVIIDMMRGEAQHVVARRYRMHNEQVRRIVSEYPYKHQKPAYLGHAGPYGSHEIPDYKNFEYGKINQSFNWG